MKEKREKPRTKRDVKAGGSKGVCIFGGTFDPIHYGHLILANKIKEQLGVDKIIFVPSYFPPHKNAGSYSDFNHRYKMVELAIADNPDFMLSDIEHQQKGVSYSYKTINYFRDFFSLDKAALFFLIGGDSLVNFHQWKNPYEILDKATVVAVDRKNADYSAVEPSILSDVKITETPLIEISSTDIRHDIKTGKSVKYQLPDVVIDYIIEQQLYN